MSPLQSDRPLKRLVADIAASRPEDITAILGELDPDQRQTVVKLLSSYRGGELSLPQTDLPPPRRISGLSAWLQARLDGQDASTVDFALADGLVWDTDPTDPFARRFTMTPTAQAALQSCASEMVVDRQAPSRRVPSGLTWIGRLRQMLVGDQPR